MQEKTLKELDPLLHSQLRLGIISLLMSVEMAEFTYLQQKTGASSGNISVQLDKLSKASYITIEKEFVGKKPRTLCKITEVGRQAFERYVETLKSYIE